ncbi:MAG: UvrD-helicase domain-containing protein, partial [Gemmatimonadota bacterium]
MAPLASLFDGLNEAQRLAVEQVEGPLLVLAGAGSGKTRVLTYRIAHLVENVGVAPWRILALTFTNKAAGEMRERVEKLVGPAARELWMGTFHSVCARLLRYEAAAFGLHPSFTIYDEDDRRALIRRVLDTAGIAEQDLAPRAVLGHITRAKNAMVDAAQFAREGGGSPLHRRVAQVYEAYEAALRANNSFDFDDLIVEPVRQLRAHPEVLERYRERFRYILIDEYQDTNRPQYLLAKLLAEGHRNICCVGDDDQSIYQFRGADIRNILDFEQDYPEARIVRLEQNYRSTGRILEAANAVIRHNRDRKGKTLWTASGDGDPISLAECADDRVEARHVVATIAEVRRSHGLSLGDAAVLYRTNAQSRVLEEELQRAGMPYVIVGSIRFYERREIKDLLAYLRILVNPADDIGLLRIINVPRRGIGETSVERLQAHATARRLSLYDALAELEQVDGLSSRARHSLAPFAALLADLRQQLADPEMTLPELAEELLERSGYLAALRAEGTPEAEVREENVGQLVSRLAEFAEAREDATLDGFLEEVALMAPVDETPESRDTVTLMTLHMAKGLEFPLVAISGLEEHVFPTSRAIEEGHQSPQAIEEERRLFYVGITRARQHLLLTWARCRYAFGALQEGLPSRFLSEVPDALVVCRQVEDRDSLGARAAGRLASRRRGSDRQGARYQAPSPPRRVPAAEGVHYEWDEAAEATQHREEPGAGDLDDQEFLAVGRWVLHPSFGRGQIVQREGHGA